MFDPRVFDLAQRIRLSRPTQGSDASLDFILSVYEEQGMRVDTCQALSITYLAWYESSLSSGVSWRDHVRKLAPQLECALDESIRELYQSYREQQREQELATVETRQVIDRMVWGSVFSGVTLASLVGGFIIHRRLKLTEQAELEAERRRQRRRSPRSARPQGSGPQDLRESSPDASA